ncbi:hypothetical protein [Magnetospirillum sp. 15-1]|nr:hypothetical protein [Magnetospirillum sp. 15-1]
MAFLDLSSPFFAGDPETVVAQDLIAGDVHWNEEGHRIIAGQLRAALAR